MGREEVGEALDDEKRAWRTGCRRGAAAVGEVPGHAPVCAREGVRVHTGCRGSSGEKRCWLKEEVIYELLNLALGSLQWMLWIPWMKSRQCKSVFSSTNTRDNATFILLSYRGKEANEEQEGGHYLASP